MPHTCISQKAILIVLDNPRGRVIEAVSAVITAWRDFSRRVHIGDLRDTLKGYHGSLTHHQGQTQSQPKVHFWLVAHVTIRPHS